MSAFGGTADIFGSKATLRLPVVANCRRMSARWGTERARSSPPRRRTACFVAMSGRRSSAEHAEEDFVSAYKMVGKRYRNMRDEEKCDGKPDPQMRRKQPIG